MSSPHIWASGFGFTDGPIFALARQAYLSGHAYFVNATGGVDSADPAGREPEEPLATVGQALTNVAAAGGPPHFIFVAANHAETLAVSQTVGTAGTHIIGVGSGSSRPRFTCSGVVVLFNITAAGCVLWNLYFPLSTAAATSRVTTAQARTIVRECYFECGANDAVSLRYQVGADSGSVLGCTFLSNGTSLSAQPGIGLRAEGAISDLEVDQCTFQGGTYGWSDYAWKHTAVVTRLRGMRIATDLKSDIGFTASTTTGYVLGESSTSIQGRLDWTA